MATKSQSVLLNSLHGELQGIIIRNILVTARGGLTYLWVTLNSETSRITEFSMTRFNNIVKIVREHVRIYWTASEAGLDQVEITKLDVAVDMKGSFLPHLHQDAY